MTRRIRELLSFLALLIGASSISMAEPTSNESLARTRLAQQMDIGEPAPVWLMNSESYAMGCDPNDWSALAESKVAPSAAEQPIRRREHD